MMLPPIGIAGPVETPVGALDEIEIAGTEIVTVVVLIAEAHNEIREEIENGTEAVTAMIAVDTRRYPHQNTMYYHIQAK